MSFLTAVCMFCLEGWTGGGIVCRFCFKPWAGSHLILGTMYSYDIFAAMPCCAERFKVPFLSFCNRIYFHENQFDKFINDLNSLFTIRQVGQILSIGNLLLIAS